MSTVPSSENQETAVSPSTPASQPETASAATPTAAPQETAGETAGTTTVALVTLKQRPPLGLTLQRQSRPASIAMNVVPVAMSMNPPMGMGDAMLHRERSLRMCQKPGSVPFAVPPRFSLLTLAPRPSPPVLMRT